MSEDIANPAEGNVPLDFLGDGTAPLELKTLVVNADGAVTRQAPPSPFAFNFTYLEIPFSACISQNGSDINLNVEADLGPLPYTAEAPKLRKPLLALLEALKNDGKFQLSLTPQKRILLEGYMPMDTSLTPVNIISNLTALLVHTDPYLELIAHQIVGSAPIQAANSNVKSDSTDGAAENSD